VGAELLRADGRTDGQTDTTNDLRNFENAPKSYYLKSVGA